MLTRFLSSNSILISYMVINVLLFSLTGCKDNKRKRTDNRIPPRFAEAQEPKFKKEGSLSFIDNKTGQVKKEIDIEIADNDIDRSKGLMFRKSMKENEGMLFIFEEKKPQSFWMKNTYIPLDIIFADDNGKIVSIRKNTKPLSFESILSAYPALYVVEVNAGFTGRFGIAEGDNIIFK
jgi:uncharacterized membrane protein (UPF0127 family)